MWSRLVGIALNLVRTDPRFSNEDEAGLLHWVMGTGNKNLEPHLRATHLLQVYAGNLMNSGRRGPNPATIEKLIAGATSFNPDEDLSHPLTLSELARRSYEYAVAAELKFVRDQDRNAVYLEELRTLGASNQLPVQLRSRTLPKVLVSTVEFSRIFCEEYAGSARRYHSKFCESFAGNLVNRFPKERYQQLRELPLVGIAVGMNFLKDSQMTAFMPRDKQNARSSFNDVRFRHAGWVVKPDMHVLRLMLWISGRAQSAGISSNTLVHLNSSQTAYASNRPRMPPVQGYSLSVGEPRGGRGEWDCIEDIHLWAVRDSVAPLGIDRLLYLIGSGKYREPLDGPASNHAYRYSLITDINWND